MNEKSFYPESLGEFVSRMETGEPSSLDVKFPPGDVRRYGAEPMTQDYPPSYFANMGQPCCSRWGKSEIEWLALAYVQALANDGDTWKQLTREQTHQLLTPEQRRDVHGGLTSPDEISVMRFGRVSRQITSSDGAWSVGGFWNHNRGREINGY